MKPIIPPVYHTSIIAKYCNEQMIELLEPWCDKLYVDCDMNTILSYISKHQQYTVTDLSEKILYYNTEITGDVIVNLDCTKLTNENYNYLSMLSRIIEDSGQKDMTQRLDIFTIQT